MIKKRKATAKWLFLCPYNGLQAAVLSFREIIYRGF